MLAEKFGVYLPTLKINDEIYKYQSIGVHKERYSQGCLVQILKSWRIGPKRGIHPFPHLYRVTPVQIATCYVQTVKNQPLVIVQIKDLEVVIENYFKGA